MIQKSCSEKSVLNTRDVTHTAINFCGKSKCREFVIRFKSGNKRVMNLGNTEWAERIRYRYMADHTGSNRISATLGS